MQGYAEHHGKAKKWNTENQTREFYATLTLHEMQNWEYTQNTQMSDEGPGNIYLADLLECIAVVILSQNLVYYIIGVNSFKTVNMEHQAVWMFIVQ